MVMCDYFSAPDDATALRVLESGGGPGPSGLDRLPLQGADPVIAVVGLEGILTGCGYEEAQGRPRSGELLSAADAEAFVVAVSPTLQSSLVAATDEQLAEAASVWAESEEFRLQQVTPAAVLEALHRLSELAGRATARDHSLYCWWSL